MFSNNLLMAAAGGGGDAGYVIEGSGLFDSANSEYLSWTPSSAGSTTTYTLSCWTKWGVISGGAPILTAFTSSTTYTMFYFDSGTNAFRYKEVDSTNTDGDMHSAHANRDPSAWIHVMLAVDTNAAEANRVRMYVNGEEINTWTVETIPASADAQRITDACEHRIGRNQTAWYGDLLHAQVCLIDGQQLTPTDFGEFDDQGYWRPIDVTGLTFGTNGFLLEGGVNVAAGIDTSSNAALKNPVEADWNRDTGSYTFSGSDIASSTGDKVIHGPLALTGDFEITMDVVDQGSAMIGLSALSDDYSSYYLDTAGRINFWWGGNGADSGIKDNNGGAATLRHAVADDDLDGVTVKVTRTAGVVKWYKDDVLEYTHTTFSYTPNMQLVFQTRGGASAVDIDNISIVSGFGNHFGVSGTITATDDSPTNDAENGIGNYCTWNPLNNFSQDAGRVLSNGNLTNTITGGANNRGLALGNIGAKASGKYYFEYTASGAQTNAQIGWHMISGGDNYDSGGCYWQAAGTDKQSAAVVTDNWGSPSSYGDGDILGFYLDLDNQLIFTSLNGSLENSATQGEVEAGTGTNAVSTSIMVTPTGSYTGFWVPFMRLDATSGSLVGTLNTGQTDFNTALYSGYKALATQNLPDPAIPDSTEHIFVGPMSHNGTTGSVTGINFDCTIYDYQVEVKDRDNSESWWVTDSLMDGEAGNWFPWDDASNNLQTGASLISSVTSTSMTFGAALASSNYIVTIRKAGLQAGRSTVSESGSGDGAVMAATISANQTAGFSIVQATGLNDEISDGEHTLLAHGLPSVPDIYQGFNQTTAAGRPVLPGHAFQPGSFSTDNYLLMDDDADKSGLLYVQPSFGNATNVKLGNDDLVNKADDTFTWYFHLGIAGYSYFGSHTGNNDAADGPMINTGMFPGYVATKNIGTDTTDWQCYISALLGYNVAPNRLAFNGNYSEATSSSNQIDILSNGTKAYSTHANTNDADSYLDMMWGGTPIQGPAPSTSTSQGRAR